MSATSDAKQIWQAGLAAVKSDRLVQRHTQRNGNRLNIGSLSWNLDTLRRIEVIGCGKAGAGMARGFESALGSDLLSAKQVGGWVNVPADCVPADCVPADCVPADCVPADCADHTLQAIQLHAARPAGKNEPTEAGIYGTHEILRRIEQLGPSDLCVCLISGGGSALLPCLRDGFTLHDLLQVTSCLSAAGATIQQLNAVRKQLSRVQGGRLAEYCVQRGVPLVTLIISDVMGDPLDVIASAPTVIETQPADAADRALEVFDKFDLIAEGVSPAIREQLVADRDRQQDNAATTSPPTTSVWNIVIGNNQTAVDGASDKARELDYEVVIVPPYAAETTAEEVGRDVAERLVQRQQSATAHQKRRCLLSGGEPVVQLAPADRRGRGGRNQQLILAALAHLMQLKAPCESDADWALLSGGTDGEDGPTDAAGACINASHVAASEHFQTRALEHLHSNDAYPFLNKLDALLLTGPTHTNVCDLRVLTVADRC